MKKILYFFILNLFFIFISNSFGQSIEIRKSTDQKVSFSVQNFIVDSTKESINFLEVLKNDLVRSGYFKLTNTDASFSLKGSVKASNKISCKIYIFNNSDNLNIMKRSFDSDKKNYRYLAHKIADEIIFAVTKKKGMSSAKLALVGNISGHKELYICDIDGANLRQVSNDKNIIVAPEWTPNGNNIIYTSYKMGYPNIYQTGQSKPLSNYGGLNVSAAVSPDSKYIAMILSKDGNPELYLKELKTEKLIRLTATRRANEASPCWSPDGKKLAYVSDSSGRPHIYVLNLNGGKPQRISSSGSENVSPNWGPNGLIVYSSRQSGRYKIVICDINNRSSKTLSLDNADYEDPYWTPDGRHIVASRSINYRSSIYLLDTLEERSIPLVNVKGDWYSPSCTR